MRLRQRTRGLMSHRQFSDPRYRRLLASSPAPNCSSAGSSGSSDAPNVMRSWVCRTVKRTLWPRSAYVSRPMYSPNCSPNFASLLSTPAARITAK